MHQCILAASVLFAYDLFRASASDKQDRQAGGPGLPRPVTLGDAKTKTYEFDK